jgi:Gpi18-like mannosyltransferase
MDRVRRHPLLAIILLGIALRLALTPLYANLPDGLLDEGFWKHWMQRIDEHGVLNIFRVSDTDYVGYHWVLWLLSIVYDWIGGPYTQTTPSLHILVKMPSIIFDVALILVVHRATSMLVAATPDLRDSTRRGLPLVAAGVIALHPVVLYDSAVWAQTDSAIAAAMLGAILLAYATRPAWSGASYALGLAVKPHPVIVGPLLLLLLVRAGGVRAFALFGTAAIGITALILGPWILYGDAGRIVDVYQELFTRDNRRLSELAWNVWWISDYLGDPRPGTEVVGAVPFVNYRLLSLALSVCAAALAFAVAARRPGLRGALIAAAYQSFAFYALPVGSHERYLYPMLVFLLPVALIERRWLLLYAAVSLTLFLNLVTVAPPMVDLRDRWVYSAFGVWVAIVNMALFTAFTVVLVREIMGRAAKATVPESLSLAGEPGSRRETVSSGRVARA